MLAVTSHQACTIHTCDTYTKHTHTHNVHTQELLREASAHSNNMTLLVPSFAHKHVKEGLRLVAKATGGGRCVCACACVGPVGVRAICVRRYLPRGLEEARQAHAVHS